MRTRRFVPIAIAALTLSGALSGCGSSGSTATDRTTTVAPTTAATPSVASSAAPTTVAPTTTEPPSGAPCTAAHLSLSLGEAGAAAGSRYQTLIFTNEGARECSLTGYPGVTLRDGSGKQIGQPATRAPGDVAKIMLAAHGGQASFFLHTTADLTGNGCESPSASISVFPPNQTATVDVDGAITICDEFQVSPVVVGTTGH